MLKSDIKRFMTGPVFWLLILVGFVVYTSDFLSFMAYNLIHGLPKEGLREYVGSNLLAFYVELSTSLIGWIYPLLCIIPFFTSLVDEYSNGALRLLVYRTGREKYLWSRFVSVGLSGGLCCSIVICLSAVLTGSILPMAGTSLPEGWPTPERDMQIIKEFNFFYEYFQNVNQSSPSIFFIYAAHQIILNFIGGFIFAVFALGIST